MALICVYQGNSKTISLQFADINGNPINISGFEVRGVAKRKYTDPNDSAIINTAVTGVDTNAVTGLVYFPLTTGDTAQCVGNYLFDFLVTDLNSGRSTYPTDGLSIMPTTYIS